MICKLIPACKDYIWGGQRLKNEYGKNYDGSVLAETWELSCHADGASVLEKTGETLADYIAKNPQAAGSACGRFEEFPVLVKLIDAAKSLSIQVHPSDEYARKNENQLGKTEMWYIVDATPEAFIYYGFKEEISKDELCAAIENDSICDKLNKVSVKKGECYFIPAGTMHAIGAGCLIAEVQQNSNVTYRVYDFGRVGADGKPRELHVKKACDVAKLMPSKSHNNFHGHLAQCEYFTVDAMDLNDETRTLKTDGTSFNSLLILSGKASVICGGEALDCMKGDSVFVSADSGEYTVSGNFSALLIYVEKNVYRVGIDLGGTNIKAGVVNAANEIIASYKCKTLSSRPWQEILADMATAAKKALEAAKLTADDCEFLGIGTPGTVDAATGDVVYSNNLCWENVPLASELRRLVGLPVYVSNDANCAALGEFVAGAAEGVDSTVLLTLGTGVGGGVVFDGKIFEGGGAGGAELGHTTLIAGGEHCTCGRDGCCEAYCSATALVREANKAADAHPDSLLAKKRAQSGEMNGIIPFAAARESDEAALGVVNQYIEWLGETIVNMVNIFRPDIVLLSGGICGEGKYLTDPLNEYVKKYSFAGTRVRVPEVKRATLGNDAGIIGAANLN